MITLATAILSWTASIFPVTAETVVGANVRVSREESPYGEPYIAQHPRIADRLVGIASKFTESGPTIPVAFVSRDGGRTWQEKALPTGTLSHAVDSWISFAETGTAYANVLVIEPGQERTRIAIFRSDDDGESWARVSTIAAEGSYDLPKLAARGKEVVVAVEYRGGLALLHSRDRGRTFGSPRLFRPSENVQHNAMNPIWRGSSVFVPYVDYGETLNGSRLGIVHTTDFGRTWSQPAVVADMPRRFPGPAEFAASNDRFHAAFASGTVDARTISVVSSADGVAWGQPKQVSNRGAQAFRPAIALSSRGHVGITWIEADSGCTRLWFSISKDGARTFAQPVPVSDEYSCGDTPQNRIAFQRWEHGGDYFGLTAHGASFVAIWTDARTGTFQIYSAKITPGATEPSPPSQ